MSKEKQIEEMALDLYELSGTFDENYIAERLYEMGYRKQSGVTDINVGSKSEWISVEERLPDIDELCLLSMENRITKYRWVVIGYFHTNYDEYVTHWMPLPEAPKMRKEDEGK